MRLSNGTDITYGEDHEGHAIILDGDLSSNRLTNSPVWTRADIPNNADTRHLWRLPKGSSMERTTNNLPLEFFNTLTDTLQSIATDQAHPALKNGFAGEAQRLLPIISPKANEAYLSFIEGLETRYGIDYQSEGQKEMANFVDDIGPTLLTIVNGAPAVLPEIPPVYHAPKDWSLYMWQINNHMMGPLMEPELEDHQRIQFNGLSLDSQSLTPQQRGLYYFHMSRFILIFEGWTGNPRAPYLLEFIRLIDAGIDPFG